MTTRHRVPTRSGFSLIELLVVASILAVLFGLLFPVIGTMKAGADAVRCRSNLRQCTAAHLAYAIDNKGMLPLTTRQVSLGSNNQIPWMLQLTDYYDRKAGTSTSDIDKTAQCPAFRRVAWPVLNYTGGQNYRFWGYVRNNYLVQDGGSALINQPNFVSDVGANGQFGDWCQAGWCSPVKMSQLSYPSQRFLVGDGYNAEHHLRRGNTSFTYSASGAGTSQGFIAYQYAYLLTTNMGTNIAATFTPAQIRDAMTKDAHRGRRSYGMCDGSVQGLNDDASSSTNTWWLSIMDPAKVKL